MFRFRGGYAWTGSPFRNNIAAGDADFSSHTFTGGLGIKEKGYSFDVAYAHKLSKEYDLQYNLPEGSGDVYGAELDKTTGTVVMTVGFRF